MFHSPRHIRPWTCTRPSPHCAVAANDNPPAGGGSEFQRRLMLRDALRHLDTHGTHAAEQALDNAREAFFAGNRDAYRHWLAIGRVLDRRVAAPAH